jgi:hypothetical protein
MHSSAVELLAALRAVLDRLGMRWYLFGAQAVIAYGAPRLTADVDVTVELGPHTPEALVAELATARFRPRVHDVGEFARRTRVLPFVHEPSALPLDVVLAGPGPEEEFLARARPIRFGDVDVPVIAREDLVAVKILAGRPQDLQDAAAIVHAAGEALDLALVRATLGLFESALDRRDLVSAFERIVRRAQRAK